MTNITCIFISFRQNSRLSVRVSMKATWRERVQFYTLSRDSVSYSALAIL